MRAQLLLFMLMFIGESIELIPTSQGTAWILGTMCSLYVMYSVSNQRWNPGGVIPFCRSMGTPEVEEFMFSYSWKQQENDIRTLAKAVWNAGAGVWIDVLKLSAGDEIRPVTRTMVRACFRSIVFLSKSYISSPNCCIEFWEAAQFPEKLTSFVIIFSFSSLEVCWFDCSLNLHSLHIGRHPGRSFLFHSKVGASGHAHCQWTR
jgi:hypothetical protein